MKNSRQITQAANECKTTADIRKLLDTLTLVDVGSIPNIKYFVFQAEIDEGTRDTMDCNMLITIDADRHYSIDVTERRKLPHEKAYHLGVSAYQKVNGQGKDALVKLCEKIISK